ncbi:MMPL family transporter [Streptomyces profundus]|uniref:MMPL family transporter n=1 Tax=Streptomyces profundus TaxID=2867410 RepID=UPI001D167FB3|nr:MMPL family transporter [Streptomyces sp. MA3_2.13]UED85444.1 MMPL family transporter [Streptomyces sp. MA3_2.13]
MLARLAQFVLRRRKSLLYVVVLLFAVSGAVGGSVFNKLSTGGYVDSSTESARGTEALQDRFGAGDPNLVLLVTDERGVDDPVVAEAGAALTQRLGEEPDVVESYSYWTLGGPPELRGENADRALVLARIDGDEDDIQAWMDDHIDAYEGDDVNGLTVQPGGVAQANEDITTQTEKDLFKAEALVFPVILIALVLVFGGVVAAMLPLGVGLFTMAAVFLLLRVLTEMTDVSVLALNIATGLGLGLAIDYSLFIISRYREELRRGADTDEAIVIAMRTAGRTVLFSALTVAIALSGLLVFPFYFLRSFAYAGIPTALLAAAASLTMLPALLKVLGPRIDKWRIRKHRDGGLAGSVDGQGFWYRLALRVMRFPVLIGTSIVALLLVLGSPFLDLKLGLADERVLPRSAASHEVGNVVREEFNSQEHQAMTVVLEDLPDAAGATQAIDDYARELSGLPGVAHVETVTGGYHDGAHVADPGPQHAGYAGDGVYLKIVPEHEAMSEEGERLVHDVRDTPAPSSVLVSGPSAELVDSIDSMMSRLPLALGIIVGSTFVLLFLMTGSLLLPAKALVLNLLSLSATFGALVWGFQSGHLEGIVGDFTVTGTITWSVPILLFCVAFGLSMDYEVFLLSRIKESYDKTGDNQLSVAQGLGHTGRLISAAAVLIAIVFIGFLTSGVVYLKAIGLGLALAVIMDATLVRGALVPSFMRLAGRANWWAPKPLRRVHDRFGLRESVEIPAQAGAPNAAGTSGEAGRSTTPPGTGD